MFLTSRHASVGDGQVPIKHLQNLKRRHLLKINDLVEKILAYGQKINSIVLRPYQFKRASQLVRAVILHEPGIFTSLWCRKSGKSETLKVVFLSLMSILPGLAHTRLVKEFPRLALFKHGLSIAFAGPKLETARIPFARLRRQARQKKFKEILTELNINVVISNYNQFELSNGSIATAYSGSETASNEGPEAQVLILDEMQSLSPFSVYKILRPMVAAVNGLISETGTAGRKKCPFLSDIEYNIRKAPEFHQEVPYPEVVKFSEDYASFISSEIDRLPGGLDNPFFRMNYLLQWLIAEGHFVDPDLFLKLNIGARGPGGGRLAAGVDWGKVNSETTITIIEERGDRGAVVDLFGIKGDWDHQFQYIFPFLKKFPLVKIFAETTGVGDPLVSRLIREFGREKVVGKFMSATYKDQIFTNLQTEITAKPESRFEYFDDNSKESNAFIRQFLDAEQEMKGDLLSVHKPEDDGAADDYLISTALADDALKSTPIITTGPRQSAQKRGLKKALSNF